MGNTTSTKTTTTSTTTTTVPITTRQILPTEVTKLQIDLTNTITKAQELKTLLNTVPTKIDFANNLKTAITEYNIQNKTESFQNYSDYYLNEEVDRPDHALLFKGHNTALSLLDDPLGRNQAAFDTYVYLQNKKINDLDAQINQINSTKTTIPINGKIKSIKNLGTSTMLNVEEYDVINPTTTTPNSTIAASSQNNSVENINKNYLILGNNGCLSYTNDATNKIAPNKFDFVKCDANDVKQKFILKQINNRTDYNNLVDDKYKINNQPYSPFFTAIPYNAYNENQQCVTINNEGLTIERCNLDNNQRFKQFYNPVVC